MGILGLGDKTMGESIAPYVESSKKQGEIAAVQSSEAAKSINTNSLSTSELQPYINNPAEAAAPFTAPKPSSITPNKKADADSGNTSSSGGAGGNSSTSFDVFKILGLSETGYYHYVPIIFKSAKILDEGSEEGLQDLEIKLPLFPSKISDSVSVSYKRRADNTTLAMITQALASALKIPDSIAKAINYEYDASSLTKEVTVPYIIPVTGVGNGGYQKVPELRRGLNILQGMVYPRLAGMLYPPHLSMTIGGMYAKLKGFIKSVSVEFDENVTDISGVKFPLLITGSITFTCLQAFSWDNVDLAGNTFFGDKAKYFILKDSTLLFGEENVGFSKDGTPANMAGKKSAFDKSALKPNDVIKDDAINKMLNKTGLKEGIKGFDAAGIGANIGAQQDLIGGMNLAGVGGGLGGIGGIGGIGGAIGGGLGGGLGGLGGLLGDLDINNLPLDGIPGLQNMQGDLMASLGELGCLDSLGINLNTDALGQSVGKLSESLAKLGTSADVGQLLGNLQNSNIFNDLGGVVNAASSSITGGISGALGGLSGLVNNNINILASTLGKVGIDPSKVFEFSSSIDGALGQLSDLATGAVGSVTKGLGSMLNNVSMADNIRINNAMKVVDKIFKTNVDMLKTSKGNVAAEILGQLQVSGNTLLAGDIVSKLANIQKQSTQAIFEKTQIDFMNNNIDYDVKRQAESAMNFMSTVMPKNMNSSVNAVHNKLKNIINVLV